ncbi:MAG: hypothetical protein ACI4VM_08430 [Anaerovoracaceae bacterium]
MLNAKKLAALGLSVVLLLGMCACGGKEGGKTGFSSLTPAANVKAQDLDCGSADNGDDTSDYWYPEGVKGDEYLFFMNAGSESGRSVSFVKAGETTGDYWLKETDEGHLVPEDGDEVDLLIYDNFTCYEAVSGVWYSRGDEAELAAKLPAVYVREERGEASIEINADATAKLIYGQDEYPGTWALASPTVFYFYEDGREPTRMTISYDADGKIASISDGFDDFSLQA